VNNLLKKTVKEIAQETEEALARAARLEQAAARKDTMAYKMTHVHPMMMLGMVLVLQDTTQSTTVDARPVVSGFKTSHNLSKRNLVRTSTRGSRSSAHRHTTP
jgi:hypothetical protein